MLVAAAALAAAASVQAATYAGDLLIGFTSTSGNDFVLDLGPYFGSNLQPEQPAFRLQSEHGALGSYW